MQQTIVLIGAGSASFGLGTIGDIFKSKTLAGSRIVLHDINPNTLQTVAGIAQKRAAEKGLPFTISATTDRKEALQGADFCISSIEVGNRFDLWEQDWQMPLLHGFHQIYGENGGPGGLFHSLRIIPPVLEICVDINAICPNAYFFNFSNPMTRVTLAIKRKFPALKAVGLCHEIASLPHHLPKMLNTPLSNLSFTAGGLNHFSVLLEARYKDSGADAYPDIRAKAPAYFEKAESSSSYFSNTPAPRPWAGRRLFMEILDKFGYLPITEDSHFGEYIQWAYGLADHKDIHDFYQSYKAWSFEEETETRIDGSDEGVWQLIPIIEGILSNSGHTEQAVNLMNDGYIDNLPRDMVVEVPAIVDENGLRGVKLGALPKGIAGLMSNQAAAIDLAVEAALTGSRRIALQALLVDPIVTSLRQAETLLDDMLELQKPYLGYIL